MTSTDAALVLVLNAGSSSLKYSLVDADTGEGHVTGIVERVGTGDTQVTHSVGGEKHTANVGGGGHQDAIAAVLEAFDRHGPALDVAGLLAVGHRVVHGGTELITPTLVDDALVRAVEALVPLAPLHNSANLAGLQAARTLLPDLPQVAVFDTAFHHTLEPAAYTYAVPESWREEHGVRRYGFHGTSCAYVSRRAAALLGRPQDETNLIVLHLGNGASATAVRGRRSVDTSMGLTPLEGLVMGTRSGDLDPAVPGHLRRRTGLDAEAVDELLNKESGIKGLAGDSDMRDVERRAAAGDARARLAIEVYCHRIRKYVGAYYAVLGRVDAVVFTAGVGERSPLVRASSLAGLDRLGIRVDEALNDRVLGAEAAISPEGGEVAVLVIPTNEEWEIAQQTMTVVRAGRAGS